jgi:hypothetical protein
VGSRTWIGSLVAIAAAIEIVGAHDATAHGILSAPRADGAVLPSAGVVVLPTDVRDSMDAIFRRGNQHWDELAGESTLTQMLGTGKPTQLEYMGCLRGRAAGDTVWVDGTVPAAGMKRFQFAVTGTCEHVEGLVGTWHTHPYRASPAGKALKEPVLSATDLATFGDGADRVVIAVWDADSTDVAVRGVNGAVRHPSTVVVRGRDLP